MAPQENSPKVDTPKPETELVPAPQAGRDAVSALDEHVSVLDRIDPMSALPVHLQNKSFDRDLWDRVKKHPLRNPTLFRTNLDDDVATREIVRQVLAAASEREKEILLHNQSRVFREVLGRFFEGFRVFLGTPIVARRWLMEPSQNSPAAERVPTVEALVGAGASGSKGWVATVLAFLLTPQYILLAVAVFFGLATGYSQLQVSTLKSAVETYKSAAEATNTVQTQMHEVVTSAKADREKFEQDRTKLDGELVELRSGYAQKDGELAASKERVKGLDDQTTELKKQLDEYRKKQTDDVKKIQAKADIDAQALKDKNAELAKSAAENGRLQEQVKGLTEKVGQAEKLITDKSRELNESLRKYSDLFYTNAALSRDRTVLRFAETALQFIRQEANQYGTMQKDRVKQYLAEFETGKANVMASTK